MLITVADLSGKIHGIDGIDDTTTVKALKVRIQAQLGYPVDQLRIIFTGKQLKNEMILVKEGVEENSRLTLALSLIGD